MNGPLKVVVDARPVATDIGFVAAYVHDWLDFEAAAKLARSMDEKAAEQLKADVKDADK